MIHLTGMLLTMTCINVLLRYNFSAGVILQWKVGNMMNAFSPFLSVCLFCGNQTASFIPSPLQSMTSCVCLYLGCHFLCSDIILLHNFNLIESPLSRHIWKLNCSLLHTTRSYTLDIWRCLQLFLTFDKQCLSLNCLWALSTLASKTWWIQMVATVVAYKQ